MSAVNDRLLPILLPVVCRFLTPAGSLPPPNQDVKRTLSKVCKKWRRIVTSNASLWADIRLAPGRFQHPEHLLSLFQQSVELSQGRPLSLHMFHNLHCSFSPNTTVKDLLYGGGEFNVLQAITLPEAISTRLVSLTSLLCGDDILEFLRLPSSTFPVLQRVEISFIHTLAVRQSPFTWDPISCLDFSVFEDHTTLTEATFHIFNCIHPLDLKLPWGRLTKLNLASAPMPPWIFLTIMNRASPSLIDGAFNVKFVQARHRALLPKLIETMVPVLKRLRLVLVDPVISPKFFGLLMAPALEKLKLEVFDSKTIGWELGLFTPLLKPTSASLRHLEFKNFCLMRGPDAPIPKARRTSYSELEAILDAVPRLEVLRLAPDVDVHLPTLEKVASGRLVPRLEVLELFTAAPDVVLWMVRQRALEVGTSQRPGSGSRRLSQVDLWVRIEEVPEVVENVRVAGLSELVLVRGLA
ncbi:unnamed protein product [Cyclocybe aegerita]|uniref:F-box domain-containing protein n=1 Tax=Cyclocybe aegerita TaxID=1973307 RepID=A0A8S0VS25_CYCAE|nr:unnamed protein product [Cyclocybe aegerita]